MMANGRIGPRAWRKEPEREREREEEEEGEGEGEGGEGEGEREGEREIERRVGGYTNSYYSQQWMVCTCSVRLQSPGLYYGSHW